MIFTEHEYNTLCSAVDLARSNASSEAEILNLRLLGRKLRVMHNLEKAARVKEVMRDMLEALSREHGPNTNLYPGWIMDAADNMVKLLEDIGGA